MKDKEKQIEEILSIAKIVDKKCDYVKCKNCNVLDNYTDEQLKGLYCSEVKIAENIFNAGYRKQPIHIDISDNFLKEWEYELKQAKEQAVKKFYTKVRNQIMLLARIQTVDTLDDTPDLLSDEVLGVLDETLKEVIGEKE